MCGSCCIEGRDEIVLKLTPPNEPGEEMFTIKKVIDKKISGKGEILHLQFAFKRKLNCKMSLKDWRKAVK